MVLQQDYLVTIKLFGHPTFSMYSITFRKLVGLFVVISLYFFSGLKALYNHLLGSSGLLSYVEKNLLVLHLG